MKKKKKEKEIKEKEMKKEKGKKRKKRKKGKGAFWKEIDRERKGCRRENNGRVGRAITVEEGRGPG